MNFRHSYHLCPLPHGSENPNGVLPVAKYVFPKCMYRNQGNNHRVGPWSIYVHYHLDLIYNRMYHLTTVSP